MPISIGIEAARMWLPRSLLAEEEGAAS